MCKPIPVAVRSKAWVCGRSLTRIMGSNPTGGMDVCLLWVLCVVRYRSLRRAGPSSRGVLLSVVCLKKNVILKPRKMRRPRPPRGCRAIKKRYPCEKNGWRTRLEYREIYWRSKRNCTREMWYLFLGTSLLWLYKLTPIYLEEDTLNTNDMWKYSFLFLKFLWWFNPTCTGVWRQSKRRL
jgi:hypothetical protein